MSLLTNDTYRLRFWRNCPEEVLDRMDTQVFPAARRTEASCATDAIMPEACNFSWYKNASSLKRHQFHSLVGHVVRIARDYVVDRTPGGKPKQLRSERGPHTRFTLQVRRHQPGEAKTDTGCRKFAGGPLTPAGVAEIEQRFNAGQADSEIAQAMRISLGGVSKRRRLWRRGKAK